jgi:hypothetical protein
MTKYLFVALLFTTVSCNLFSELGPQAKISIDIKDLQKEQIDSLKVQDHPHSMQLVVSGELSDSVKIIWSVFKDSLFSPHTVASIYSTEILKKGKVKRTLRYDFYGKTLYFRYLPFNSNTQGNLKADLMLF